MERFLPGFPPDSSPSHRSVSGQPLHRLVSWLLGAFLIVTLVAGCGDRGLVENPIPLYGEVPIEYPLDLWDADVEGEILLRVRVTEMGTVDSVEVLEASGYPAFDSAAVRGALRLEYRPAQRNGRRIPVWAKVPIQFTKGQP